MKNFLAAFDTVILTIIAADLIFWLFGGVGIFTAIFGLEVGPLISKCVLSLYAGFCLVLFLKGS